jgi:lipopolysaccharide/colanic/teichoic acid biosynthesis glycosyltransferase
MVQPLIEIKSVPHVTPDMKTRKREAHEGLNTGYSPQLALDTEFQETPHLNSILLDLHGKLASGGLLLLQGETLCDKRRKLDHVPAALRTIIWFFNFVYHRFLAKTNPTRSLYERIHGHKRLFISKAEILGRLVYCGFSIEHYEIKDGKHHIRARKSHQPKIHLQPSYGPLFKMTRVGKNGNLIQVYKLRTMHSYSEFLQEYMVSKYGYSSKGNGKIEHDFRVLSYGIFLRRIWLDELPQILNVLKGDMALVGVRPLSQARFKEFPEDVKEARIKYKPGCIPPYVSLLMANEKDNIEAERIYLRDKSLNPKTSDIRYFFLALRNILTNKIRSA